MAVEQVRVGHGDAHHPADAHRRVGQQRTLPRQLQKVELCGTRSPALESVPCSVAEKAPAPAIVPETPTENWMVMLKFVARLAATLGSKE